MCLYLRTFSDNIDMTDTAITREYLLELMERVKIIEIRHYRTWIEDFMDDDTGEIVKVERRELISTEQTCSDDEKDTLAREFIRALTLGHHLLSHEELVSAYYEIIWPDANGAANRQLLTELSESGFSTATWDLWSGYYYGDENKGLYKDKALARKYMEIYIQNGYDDDGYVAGVLSDIDKEYDDDPDPYTTKIQINDSSRLVERLINEFCERFGTPGNEFGLYVPLEKLMDALVGSKEYEGNVLGLEHNDKGLLITMESEENTVYPFTCALQDAFGRMDIEIVSSKSSFVI